MLRSARDSSAFGALLTTGCREDLLEVPDRT